MDAEANLNSKVVSPQLYPYCFGLHSVTTVELISHMKKGLGRVAKPHLISTKYRHNAAQSTCSSLECSHGLPQLWSRSVYYGDYEKHERNRLE